jgi:hypothetical protein
MAGFIGSDQPYRDGEREMTMRLVAIYPYDMERGHCFHFDSDFGYRIVWFSRRKQTLQIGDRIRARFTLYSHELFQGIYENKVRKFTILERLT